MLVAGNANAQLSVNGGFLGNVLSTSYKYTDVQGKEQKSDTSFANGLGFYAGLIYSVLENAEFSYAGKSEEKTTAGTKYTDVVDMMDLNIPILFNFKWDFTSSFGIMAFVGPNFRYGLSYKALPDGFRMQPMHPQALLQKQAAEWTNLAAILPALYAEEKDNF